MKTAPASVPNSCGTGRKANSPGIPAFAGRKNIRLSIERKTEELLTIFTKKFDGNKSIDILDESDELRFSVVNAISGDDVTVVSAEYSDSAVGTGIEVKLTLGGQDYGNYSINSMMIGAIEPTIITLSFDYNVVGQTVVSNVENNGLSHVSQLAYPFISTAYLTSNSADVTTRKNRFLYSSRKHALSRLVRGRTA